MALVVDACGAFASWVSAEEETPFERMLADLVSSHQLCWLIASDQDTAFLVTSPELKARWFEGHDMPGPHRFSQLFNYTIRKAS
jgi:hypothetical protein